MNRLLSRVRLLLIATVLVPVLLIGPAPVRAQDSTPGAIVVVNRDANGNVLTGACWILQTEDVGGYVQGSCDGADGALDGVTGLFGVAPGSYRLVENTPPVGYLAGHKQSVTVDPGQTVEVVRQDEPGGQTLIAYRVDENGNPLPGGCVQVSTDPDGTGFGGEYVVAACDANPRDNGLEDGITIIGGLPPGRYVAWEYNPPPGYVTSRQPSQPVTIREGEDAQVTFVDRVGGMLAVAVVDENGAPLPTSCFNLRAADPVEFGQAFWSLCDAFDGANDGVVTFTNLPVGDYTLEQTFVARGHRLPAKSSTVALAPGENRFTVENAAGGVDLVIETTGEEKDPVAGSCYALYRTPEQKQAFDPAASGCDGFDGETDGLLALAGLDAGEYFLVQTSADRRHLPASDRAVALTEGKNRKVRVQNAVGGAVVVSVDDGEGEELPGACFALVPAARPDPATMTNFHCDAWEEQNDGTVTLSGVAAGDYLLVQTMTPGKRATAAPIAVTVELGKRQRLTVSNGEAKQTATFVVVDEEEQPVTGACFSAFVDDGDGTRGDFAALACDWYDAFDGTVRFPGLAPGEYVVVQTLGTDANARAADQTVSVARGKNRKWSVENPTGGTVAIAVDDGNGKRVGGGCFALLNAADPDPVAPVKSGCDASDGKRDGRIALTGLATGSYVLVQTATPEGRLSATARTVDAELGKKRSLKLANPDGGQTATVDGVDDAEQPVVGSCFLLYADAGAGQRGDLAAASCDAYDANDGTATFYGLVPGDYVLAQASAPDGYDVVADSSLTVPEDEPATVTVVAGSAATPDEAGG